MLQVIKNGDSYFLLVDLGNGEIESIEINPRQALRIGAAYDDIVNLSQIPELP